MPDKIGPYIIQERLGKGGMGVVYQAMHLESGNMVALKTVRVPDQRQIASIRREIRALIRIKHPGVITIIEEGIHKGLPWYTMELLEGVTLRRYGSEFIWGGSDISTAWQSDLLDQVVWRRSDVDVSRSPWWTKVFGPTVDGDTIDNLAKSQKEFQKSQMPVNEIERVPAARGALIQSLTIIYRLCHTLAFLHGEGIIHGDLKPENILVRPEGIPKILDFGLVTQIWKDVSREMLESEIYSGGTAVYIAPEQIRGELLDARTDLYALGCIIYELLTGRPPFMGSSLKQIIISKLELDPTPPSKLAYGIPEALDKLVIRLLDRKPQHRIGHADDIASVLLGLGVPQIDTSEMPIPKAYLYRPRFAGRENLMQTLLLQLQTLESRNGDILLIGGESGIGKTRLLMRIARNARRLKHRVITSECSRTGSLGLTGIQETIPPLLPFRSLIKYIVDAVKVRGEKEVIRVFGQRGKVLAKVVPEIEDLPGQQHYSEAHPLPASAARLRLFSYLSDTLREFIKDSMMLLLDDLHTADDMTVGFLEFILRTGLLKRLPLLIVCTYRSEELTPEIQRLINTPTVKHHVLEKLDFSAVESIISDMLGVADVSKTFVSYLTNFSEGNPFFLSEYLRTAVSEGLLYRDTEGYWQVAPESRKFATTSDFESLPLPKALKELVERRLDLMGEKTRDVVYTAAAIGNDIPTLLLWNVMPMGDDLLDTLDNLIKKQVLHETEPGTLKFVHSKFRKVAYENIPLEQRKIIHMKIALAMESMHDTTQGDIAGSLARHWEQSGDTEKAAGYYARFANWAVNNFALKDADSAYRSFLAMNQKISAESIVIRLTYAENVLIFEGKHSLAAEQFKIAKDEAEKFGLAPLEARSLLGLANIGRLQGMTSDAEIACQKALSIYRQQNDEQGEAIAYRIMAGVCFARAELEKAHILCEKALAIHRKYSNSAGEAAVMVNLATVLWMLGNGDRAVSILTEALNILRGESNRQFYARCMGNLGNIYKFQGDIKKAKELYEKALEIFTEIGDRQSIGIFTMNLACVFSLMNQENKALDWFEKALKIFRDIQDSAMEGLTLNNLAYHELENGYPEEARQKFLTALDILQSINNRRDEAETLVNLAIVARLVDQDIDMADKYLESALQIYQSIGDRVEISKCIVQHGFVNLARGRSAKHFIDELNEIVKSSHAGPDSQIGILFEELKKAEMAFKEDKFLYYGNLPEDLPDHLKRWLENNNRLSKEN
ncbi:tetratricopeptide repeat protein [bacterium]|nr:tetratricopeptide repeat protein [candidate division CSSED10-310 bacterium]